MKESRWNSETNWNSSAPGDLELVRRFLNTWRIDVATREPADELSWLLGDSEAWDERFPGWSPVGGDTEDLLARLREDLRGASSASNDWEDTLNGWLSNYTLVGRVVRGDGGASVRYEPASEAGLAGRILATVARSVGDGTFSRLKTCPDCRWVFYDKTRSRTRVWCGMYAGKDGRACGTISKVKRYRQRRKVSDQARSDERTS